MNSNTACFNMVHQQIRPVGVLDLKLLEIFSLVPRERFVPEIYKPLAFSDTSIPMGYDQVMLPPKIVGRMLQALQLGPTDTVLEIGTGTGYVTALLSQLVKKVISIEIFPELMHLAEKNLKPLKLHNIQLEIGNGLLGFQPDAPLDAIIFTGSLPLLPRAIRDQIAVKGKIFAIIGIEPAMTAMLVTRAGRDRWVEESLFETVVPPLLNAPQPEGFRF